MGLGQNGIPWEGRLVGKSRLWISESKSVSESMIWRHPSRRLMICRLRVPGRAMGHEVSHDDVTKGVEELVENGCEKGFHSPTSPFRSEGGC